MEPCLKNAIICPRPRQQGILQRTSKGIKMENYLAHAIRKKKGRHVPLARGQTIVPCLYYLWAVLDFQRTAVDMKQLINTQRKPAFSSGPDADYRCHQTRSLIAHTLSFDATSRLQSGAAPPPVSRSVPGRLLVWVQT